MAMFMSLLAASCSQEEIISANGQQGGEVSLSVNIPVNNPVTRAVPNIPAGYKLRCILQLVDAANGNAIDGQKHVQEVPAGSESTTFTFTAPGEAYKCLLWADYVNPGEGQDLAAADNIYTTTDLKAIGYTPAAGSGMFNSDAADAFYACSLEASADQKQTITLKRPFTRITFASTDAVYDGYTKISVTKLPAPKGFDVMTGTTDGNAEIASPGDIAIADGKWFSAYLFTNTSAATLGEGNDIEFTLKKDGGESLNLKFAGKDIPLTPNADVQGSVTPSPNDQTQVEVTFPGGMVDPNAMAVGDYINKDGSYSKTFDAQNAIGIVYALAEGKTDNSDYGTNFTGKNIAGYAMALTSVTRSYLGSTSSEPATLPALTTNGDTPYEDGDYNGYTYSSAMLTAANETTISGSVAFTAYTAWKATNSITAANLSPWYIPSGTQIKDIGKMLFGFKVSADEVDETVKNDSFITSYNTVVTNNANAIFDLGGAAGPCWIMSSYCTPNNDVISLAGIVTNKPKNSEATDPIPSISTVTPTWSAGSRLAIRPVLTIFAAGE